MTGFFSRIDKSVVNVNVVLSMYGKNTFLNFVDRAYRENRIIKLNPDEAVLPAVQFRRGLLHQDYSNNLTQYKKIVKNIISKVVIRKFDS